MLTEVQSLAYSAVLAWAMVMVASALGAKLWTPKGFVWAAHNRDTAPTPTPLAARADRAAKNMLENLVLFAAVMLAAHFAEHTGGRVALGASVFFWARVVYWPVYLAGIPFVRTAIWGVGVAGMAMVVSTML